MPQDQADPPANSSELNDGPQFDDTAVMSAEAESPEDHAAASIPSVGDHVLYRLPTGPARGEYRAAIVTYVHGKETHDVADDRVNLAVYCGLASDLPVFPVCPAENIRHGSQLGQFVWLNEVPA